MAKNSPSTRSKSLVIVESPAKAKTISKFLGKDYVIEASIGHIRDLPEGRKEVPAKYKDKEWSYLGVNVDEDFQPIYIVPSGKAAHIKKLEGLVKECKELFLATDEDREGEAISWHLKEVLKPKIPVHRLVFHEITKEAILEALEHPRKIDEDMVKAQETRRIVDRLYGYDVSPLLWRKVRPKLSAGRVQSVAVRLIVSRERERMAFVTAEYWDLLGKFAKSNGKDFSAVLFAVNDKTLATGRDFNSQDGKLKNKDLLHLDSQRAQDLVERLRSKTFRVAELEEKPYTTKPFPPFTTSTLQQDANRKLRYSARRTMQIAQSLYENGHITYMRTDSTNLASVAIDSARKLIAEQYGSEYVPAEPRVYRTKVKNAQEAHEAIRPAGANFPFPEDLRSTLNDDEYKLYNLIWKRTIASQMSDARGKRLSVTVEGDGAQFQASGKTIDFPGYLRAYVEGSDDPEADLADRETVLPPMQVGEILSCSELETKGHSTQPPARFTEAALTAALEELGIGRPSTYAAIIDTILAREYVFKRSNALVPTWTAFAVAQLLEKHFAYLVDYQFTAQMEDDLDAISRGELEHLKYLKNFYFGNGHPGLKGQVAAKIDEIDPREVGRILIGTPADGKPVYVRVGKFGPFLEQDERRAGIPEDFAPDELNLAKTLEMLAQAALAEEPLGMHPETHRAVYLKTGRYGPYVQMAPANPDDEDDKPKNASLLKGMKPEDVTLEVAVQLLSLPKIMGLHPTDNQPVVAYNGRFGPYVKWGDETRSLGAISPLDATLEQAIELLAQPKQFRRGFGAAKEPLKVLGPSPLTQQNVQVMSGRYGNYITDGVTNATVPKEISDLEELTMEKALDLLAERAAKGPSKKAKKMSRGRGGKAPSKAAKAASPKSAKPKTVQEDMQEAAQDDARGIPITKGAKKSSAKTAPFATAAQAGKKPKKATRPAAAKKRSVKSSARK